MADVGPGTIEISEARLTDQGKLGPFLRQLWGPVLEQEIRAAQQAGMEVASVEDELMAADDFYFSSIDLMNCCYFARAGEEIVGVAAVNPYTVELQYVAVVPERRRQGIGRKLVEACIQELRNRGIGHIKIDCPAALAVAGGQAFLSAIGFQEIRSTVRMARRAAHA